MSMLTVPERRGFGARGGRVISVTQQKGGSGKTTVSAHLAVAWSKSYSVAVLDVDPQGSLGEWYEAREERLGEAGTGLSFRTASGWGARREARRLARDHDIVVIDTPPKSDIDAKPAIMAADLVVVPVQPSPIDLWATVQTLEMIEHEGGVAMLVLNRVPPRATLTEEALSVMQRFDSFTAATRWGNRVAFAACMGEGGTVLETAPRSKAAVEARRLAREIGESWLETVSEDTAVSSDFEGVGARIFA